MRPVWHGGDELRQRGCPAYRGGQVSSRFRPAVPPVPSMRWDDGHSRGAPPQRAHRLRAPRHTVVMRSVRLGAAVALLAFVAPSPGAAKGLDARFEPATAHVGDEVVLRFGETHMYVAPFRIYLVAVEDAQEWRRQSDPALIKLGEHGQPGMVGPPRTYEFVVPDVPPGEYYASVWFEGYESGRWHNVLTYPLLTIEREGSTSLLIPFIAAFASLLLLSVGAIYWRRRARDGFERSAARTV